MRGLPRGPRASPRPAPRRPIAAIRTALRGMEQTRYWVRSSVTHFQLDTRNPHAWSHMCSNSVPDQPLHKLVSHSWCLSHALSSETLMTWDSCVRLCERLALKSCRSIWMRWDNCISLVAYPYHALQTQHLLTHKTCSNCNTRFRWNTRHLLRHWPETGDINTELFHVLYF